MKCSTIQCKNSTGISGTGSSVTWIVCDSVIATILHSIAVIKRFSEHLWNPGNKKRRIKPEKTENNSALSKMEESSSGTITQASDSSSDDVTEF